MRIGAVFSGRKRHRNFEEWSSRLSKMAPRGIFHGAIFVPPCIFSAETHGRATAHDPAACGDLQGDKAKRRSAYSVRAAPRHAQPRAPPPRTTMHPTARSSQCLRWNSCWPCCTTKFCHRVQGIIALSVVSPALKLVFQGHTRQH